MRNMPGEYLSARRIIIAGRQKKPRINISSELKIKNSTSISKFCHPPQWASTVGGRAPDTYFSRSANILAETRNPQLASFVGMGQSEVAPGSSRSVVMHLGASWRHLGWVLRVWGGIRCRVLTTPRSLPLRALQFATQ